MPTSNKPSIYYGAIMDHAIQEILININTNIGPSHVSSYPVAEQHSKKGFHCKQGSKLSMDAKKCITFLYEVYFRGTSKTSIFNPFCSPDIDENSKNSKKRYVKQFVKTKIGINV